MINREIFTESPEEDLWRELLQCFKIFKGAFLG
jgi:hypothetical protein